LRSTALLAPLIAVCFVTFGCSRTSQDPYSGVIREYVRLAATLGERDSDSLDYYYGPAEWVSEARSHPEDLKQVGAALQRLRDSANVLPQSGRTEFLQKQIGALSARVQFIEHARRVSQSGGQPGSQNESASEKQSAFDQEARDFFGITVAPGQESDLEAARASLSALLPGSGPLAARYAAFDRKFMVPPEKVPAVMQRALEECRARTIQHVPLPAGEHVELEYVGNRPWNAYSYYQGNSHSRILVNAALGMTLDRALQLACHEGYPGHHAYNILQDQELVRKQGRQELFIQPTFSPQSLVSEAIATYAIDLTFPAGEREAFEHDVLLPLSGIPIAGIGPAEIAKHVAAARALERLNPAQVAIARDYLDGRLEYVRAAQALADRAAMAEADATLRYLNEFRTYMLTYTTGAEMVKACFAKDHTAPWALYQRIATFQISLNDCSQKVRQEE
jgi:hypothetical protein